jgi:ABC-type branched-subunit amino acid transport system ATPase component
MWATESNVLPARGRPSTPAVAGCQSRDRTAVAMLLAEQLPNFATGLADQYCVLDGGVVALASSAADLDTAAVHELLAA